ncbi:Crp/Fnr family transcriptional regulator [Arthrobacter rhombi]|uniref:Crp/Fnr family transcriptional regulator n=1 Tax=Arthrobacter rhombi TaxID=71253 RepID=UPI0015C6675C|nr:Crp/Fnr family transcriptional regulator [Arthrobacter rhombi]
MTTTPAGHDHRDQCVALVPIFAHLDPEEQHEIASRARQRKYRRGELLYSPGDEDRSLLIVHRGKIKTYRGSESGHEQILRVLEPGSFIGETAFLHAGQSDHYALALEDAEICSLHHEDIRGFLVSYPTIALKMLETVTERLEQTERTLSSYTGEDAGSRIAGYLLEKADPATGVLTLPMSKRDLSSLLGTTPETLSRRLAAFTEAGWIDQSSGGRIHVLDREALARA